MYSDHVVGQQTLTGSASDRLPTTARPTVAVYLTALTTVAYYGFKKDTTTANGYPLQINVEQRVKCTNLDQIYLIGTNPNKVAYRAELEN